MLLPVICAAESFDALTDESVGQLLYDASSRKVLVYQGNTPDNKWKCILFHGEKEYRVNPKSCILLNGHTANIDPLVISMELAFHGAAFNEKLFNAYHQISQKTDSPRTNELLSFYSELLSHRNALRKEVGDYHYAVGAARRGRAGGNENDSGDTKLQLLESSIKSLFQYSAPAKHLQNMSKDKDIFTLFCLYRHYSLIAEQQIRYLSDRELRRELKEMINQQGEDILKQFLQMRSHNRNRENMFKRLCSSKHGPWEFAPPSTLNEMWKRTESCYKAWKNTQNLSRYSEFPVWGNAMLEVLQMVKHPEWERQFDEAFSEYQKYNSN